jgi:YD repeat-containing protein
MEIYSLNQTSVRVALLILIFFICLGNDVSSQTVKGWEVVPPSPDAAALGKYGNTPVGLSTGIPEINIPLYVIKTKKLELPITMSYHAAGFNVNDRAPWTGLGWTLNAGGVVTRSAVGLGDDCGSGFLQHNNNRFASEINENDLQWLMQVTTGIADNESDMYFFNFAGRSGKFVFDDNRKPFLVPEVPIKITYSSSTGFHLVSEDGTIYRFAETEMIEAGVQTPMGNDFQTYTGAYYLTSITSADGTDAITFTYANDGYYTEVSNNYSETIGDKCVPTDNGIGVVGKSHDYNTSFSYRTIQDVKRLSEINFPNGKVEFLRAAGRLDGGNSSLSEIRIKKKNAAGGFDLEKAYKIETGYFGTYDHARLKLNGIAEFDASNSFVKGHEFFYNESIILPSRGSGGQDWWGLYNGGSANSLVPKEVVNMNGHFYHVGSANRSPSATHMQACILKRVKYPTGGYTEFEYEPHYYEGTSTIPKDISASSGAMNNTTDLLQDIKTFSTNRDGFALVRANCSNSVVSEIGGNPYFSTVTLRKIGGTTLVNHAYDPYPLDPSGVFKPEHIEEFLVQLSPGTYELKVTSKGTSTSTYFNGGAFSKATVTWSDFAPAGTPVIAGGLRVKETRDYDGPGAVPIIKIYKYGVNESGKGILITPENKLSSHKETRDFRYWDVPPVIGTFCRVMCSTTRQTIFGNTPHDLTTFNGSAVVYPEVAVYEKSTTAPNGKSIYKFSAQPDEIYGAPQGYKDGVILIDNSWKANDLIYQADLISNTTNKVREVINNYPILQEKTIFSTKMGRKYRDNGTCGPQFVTSDVYSAFYYFDFPIRTGVKKLGSTTERAYATTDPTKYTEAKVDYFYDNLNSNHQQLSRRVTLDSEGNTLRTQYWYPADYSAIDNMSSLITKNIINKAIKEETHRNGSLIAGKINRLNADGEIFEVYQHEAPIPLAPPIHSANTLIPSGYTKKIDVGYDATTKNITKIQSVDDVSAAYLWAYNNAYPVAKAVNASVTDIAATSFESDGKGNWVYNGAIYNDIPAKTGRYYYRLGGGSIVKGLAPGKYKLEYWAKGTVNLSGPTVANVRTSAPDANGWVLYEKELTASAATTLTLSGTTTAFIDELRLYPASAQITTYTYDRLAGITSVNDPAGSITYYDYDSSGRMKWLRDKNGSVVKAFEYHYKTK